MLAQITPASIAAAVTKHVFQQLLTFTTVSFAHLSAHGRERFSMMQPTSLNRPLPLVVL
jgi:hypothetical protein